MYETSPGLGIDPLAPADERRILYEIIRTVSSTVDLEQVLEQGAVGSIRQGDERDLPGADIVVVAASAPLTVNESRPTGTAGRFQPALSYERSLGLAHWEAAAPTRPISRPIRPSSRPRGKTSAVMWIWSWNTRGSRPARSRWSRRRPPAGSG